MTRGLLVAFEGGDGSGKSTQAARFAARIGALLTREPGGTPLGESVRGLLLDPAIAVDERAEALLMAAARAQHVTEVIEPALAVGRHVVTDRFTPSSIAYQGHGRGLGDAAVAKLSGWAASGVEADLVVLVDVPVEVGLSRLTGARDRLESEEPSFHERVALGFRAQAEAEPDRWIVVDGVAAEDEVEAAIWERWVAWREARAT